VIDFRYHLVSLVAVFIALAVGITLGAGPLRGQLSDTLEGQVAELGTERNALRSQVELHERRAADKDEAVTSMTPAAVADLLPDIRVAVLEMPDADGELADELAVTLAGAGAQLVTRTEVRSAWEAPGDLETRQEAVTEAATLLGVQDDPASVLAAVVTGTTPAGDMVVAGSAASLLEQADLISLLRTDEVGEPQLPGALDPTPPDVVVVVAGGLERPPEDEADLVAQTRTTVEGRLGIVRALQESPAPVLVVGAGTESWQDPVTDAEDLLVAAVREDGDLDGEVSTVDNVESATGRLATAWALTWELAGETGHYGLAASAEGPVPAAPPAREATADPSEPGPTGPGTAPSVPGPGTEDGDSGDDGTADDAADDAQSTP
jgi:hypothetical protein